MSMMGFCEFCFAFSEALCCKKRKSRFPGLLLFSLWRFDSIIVSESMHRATEIEDLGSSLVLGHGCALATMEVVSSMLKIKVVLKPCSVFHTESDCRSMSVAVLEGLASPVHPYLLPIHMLKP